MVFKEGVVTRILTFTFHNLHVAVLKIILLYKAYVDSGVSCDSVDVEGVDPRPTALIGF